MSRFGTNVTTWGFFLYGLWFNSGQYFVWYANLPTTGLIVFDALQAVVQALALTGFLAFALHFPDERSTQWSSACELCALGSVWVVLLVFGGWGFLNFVVGWQTEFPYRIYYGCTFCVYFVAVWFFLRNYWRMPEQRPRMRWIIAASLIGLPCFLLADIYETTALFRYLPFEIDGWIYSHDWVLNLMYGCNVLLPLAVVYTALRHEVMSVRFGITRTVILSTIFLLSVGVIDLLTKLPIESFLAERETLKPLVVPLSFVLAVGLATMHNPLHGCVERLCAPRWHRARRRLQEVAQRLVEDDSVTLAEVDRALIDDTTTALWLKAAGLFHREPDGGFVLQRHVNWPSDAKRVLQADDPWIASVTSEPVLLTDASDEAGGPALVVPIVRRGARQRLSRFVLYGHHLTLEQIDPDEIRILHGVSRAAAVAYLRLELEAASEVGVPRPRRRGPVDV